MGAPKWTGFNNQNRLALIPVSAALGPALKLALKVKGPNLLSVCEFHVDVFVSAASPRKMIRELPDR
jgi:hypothetical protein